MLPFPPPKCCWLWTSFILKISHLLDTTDAQLDQYYQCDSNNTDEEMKCHTLKSWPGDWLL